jgi:hypothetical protein
VQVDVEDRLAGIAVRVEDRAIAAVTQSLFSRDCGGAPHDFAHQRVVRFGQLVEGREMSSNAISRSSSYTIELGISRSMILQKRHSVMGFRRLRSRAGDDAER